jgi:dipeptidyl aminopeptidase/acylaminoacyl peptidase
MDDMLLAETDFLLVQGGSDLSAPAAHARIVADRFARDGRCNLTYLELPGLNHGLVDPDGTSRLEDTLELAAAWAGRVLAQTASSPCARPEIRE